MSNKGKVYRTKVTPKAAMYGAIPLVSALVLAHFALDAAHKFHPSDPTRLLFVGIPALLSAVIIISLIVTANHFLHSTIGIRDKELLYKHKKTMRCLRLNRLN